MGTPIQKLFTDRKNTNGTTFVGEKGRLWYDPVNGFRISDGITPGGKAAVISVSTASIGDLVITGASISTINPNEGLNLVSNGTGTISVSGAFNVSTPSGTLIMQVPQNGFVNFYAAQQNVTDSAFEIIGSSNGASFSPTNSGVMLQVTGNPNVSSRIYNDSENNYSVFAGRRYDGTASNPTAVQAGEDFVRYGGSAYNGTIIPTAGNARMVFTAVGTQTNTNGGSAISFWTVPFNSDSTAIAPVMTLTNSVITMAANMVPNKDVAYDLGTPSNRWRTVYVGTGSVYIQDATLGTNAEITVNNGVMQINGANQLQVGQLKFVDNTIESTTGAIDIQIGLVGSSANLVLNRNVVIAAGKSITFSDGTTQTTAAIPLTTKGVSLGVATLGADGKLLSTQIPTSLTSAVSFAGGWNANTNTPNLANNTSTYTTGTEFVVTVGGTQNLGSGTVYYSTGSFILYGGGIWNYSPQVSNFTSITGTNHIGVNAPTGVIQVTSDATSGNTPSTIVSRDASGNFIAGTISAALSGNAATATKLATATTINGVSFDGSTAVVVHTAGAGISISGAQITNAGVTSATAGTGITVSGSTGAVTFTNSGVTSAVAGTGITVSGSTGAVTFTNSGVTSAVAGTGITVSASTGAVTFGVAAATTSALGAVQPDGTTILVSGGVISTAALSIVQPNYVTVSSAGTYTASTLTSINILLYTAGSVNVTWTMPPNPIDGQVCKWTNASTQTSVFFISPGVTLVPAISGPYNAGTKFQYVYRSADNKWYACP